MEFHIIEQQGRVIAEVTGKGQLIAETQDAVDLLGNCYYQGANSILLYQHQLSPAFFDLKTGIAGSILQKFSNYNMRLAIVGDYSGFSSKSLKDFIYESNKQGQICFVASKEEAIEKLTR